MPCKKWDDAAYPWLDHEQTGEKRLICYGSRFLGWVDKTISIARKDQISKTI